MHEQLQKLFLRRQVGVKFGLENIQKLCAALGNPERDLKFIHIAGTNGKGSVAAMCEAMLKELGFKVGLYTSPHLVRYNERFRFNGKEISDAALEPLVERVLKISSGEITFFEISTAVAFLWFQQIKADAVVLETGLGGRLDATNVVHPVVSVITAIGFDHMQFLGNSLKEIAGEKAGIIKSKVPIITQSQDPEVQTILQSSAKSKEAPLIEIMSSQLGEFKAPLTGEHQAWNMALAVTAVREFCKQNGKSALTKEVLEKGLCQTRWPGRCQVIERASKPVLMIDGAHNPLGIKALVQEIKKRWGDRNVLLIFGAVADKNIKEMLDMLRPVVREIFLTRVPSERSASLEELSLLVPEAKCFESLQEALEKADQQPNPIVIAGSLFLVGQALSLVQGKNQVMQPNELFSSLRT
jgi:dihydrofolate synthase / folylpolyglutamate synthase